MRTHACASLTRIYDHNGARSAKRLKVCVVCVCFCTHTHTHCDASVRFLSLRWWAVVVVVVAFGSVSSLLDIYESHIVDNYYYIQALSGRLRRKSRALVWRACINLRLITISLCPRTAFQTKSKRCRAHKRTCFMRRKKFATMTAAGKNPHNAIKKSLSARRASESV